MSPSMEISFFCVCVLLLVSVWVSVCMCANMIFFSRILQGKVSSFKRQLSQKHILSISNSTEAQKQHRWEKFAFRAFCQKAFLTCSHRCEKRLQFGSVYAP